jgi:hypothetical protein
MDRVIYNEPGADYFTYRNAEQAMRHHVQQLEALRFHASEASRTC